MIVVSDASPLNYLVLIDAVEVLPALFGRVITTPAVWSELHQEGTPEVVRRWTMQQPPWLEIRAPEALDPSLEVDRGEAEAISLSVELRADALLIDDRKGRLAATARSIPTLGTLAVLEVAAERGLLALPGAVAKLRATNFRASDDLILALLVRDELRRTGPPD
jgi:predicted nucleic acid-binding protein